MNEYYLNSQPNSVKKNVICHEFGHLLGMAHDNTTAGTCMKTPAGSTITVSSHDRSMISGMFGSLPSICSSCPKITLLTAHDSFVWATNAGGSSVQSNAYPAATQYTVFRLIDLGGGYVALQADNGQYVVAEGGGGGYVNANRNSIGQWETFKMIELGGGNVAFQASNNQYLVAEDTSLMRADRDDIGSWETFLRTYQ